ncbi:hypothetical protein BP5796_11906 [Coleophoma crateriformis]|uniref:Uncharacterized protein n=1 Tax=Coleophoma crateriformis TaxID=565419 RepID=A0A3D8QF78_9HELO|nr:hypothetical protein BP5796_11906 [Coleophoma crateriformis]
MLMLHLMAKPRQPDLLGPLGRLKRISAVFPGLRDAEMARVRLPLQPINHNHVAPFHQSGGALGNGRAVRDVGKAPDAVPEVHERLARGEELAMLNQQRGDFHAVTRFNGEFFRLLERVPAELGQISPAGRQATEDEVREGPRDLGEGPLGAVDIDVLLHEGAHSPAAQVIEAEVGIGVGVGNQQGIDAAELVRREPTQRRRVEGLAAVHEKVLVVDAEHAAGVVARVLRERRRAGFAGGRIGREASDHGDAATCA